MPESLVRARLTRRCPRRCVIVTAKFCRRPRDDSHRDPTEPSQSIHDAIAGPSRRSRIARVSRRSGRSLSYLPSDVARDARLPPAPTPRTLDELSAHWRLALFAAQDVLTAARRCGRSVGLRSDEVSTFERSLADERVQTARLLEALAHEEHISLRNRLTSLRATHKRSDCRSAFARACSISTESYGKRGDPCGGVARQPRRLPRSRLERTGERFGPFRPFSTRRDYYRYLHGKPRLAGAHAFLASRGIKLPEGRPDDSVDAETVFGLANRKNEAFQRRLASEGSMHSLERFSTSRRRERRA